MTLKIRLWALCAVLLTGLILAAPASAGYKLPDLFGPSDTCVTKNKQLHLAQAYETHLEEKGQDGAVISNLYKASIKSGVDFELLLVKAILESDLGRFKEARHSSARGVFQYIEPTWLVLIKRYGKQIGYPEYARAVSVSKRSGIPYFKGPAKYLRPEILALRYDPEASALIKAYQIKEETDVIRSFKRSKKVTATDHYIAHMMGLALAKELYDLKYKNSVIAVARLNKPEMREAAKLNRLFFYDGKRALTATAVYRKFEQRINRELKRIRNVAINNKGGGCAQLARLQNGH